MQRVDMQEIQDKILDKFKRSGIQSLTSSEMCFTLLSQNWYEVFHRNTGQIWETYMSQYMPILIRNIKSEKTEYLQSKSQRYKAGQIFLKSLDSFYEPNKVNNNEASFSDFSILQKLSVKIAPKSLFA